MAMRLNLTINIQQHEYHNKNPQVPPDWGKDVARVKIISLISHAHQLLGNEEVCIWKIKKNLKSRSGNYVNKIAIITKFGLPYANHLLEISLQSSHHVSVKIKFWVSSAMCLQRKGRPANCYK
jgi:hypothetical protein